MTKNQQKVESLIADLGSKDGSVRIKARLSLVATGEPAVAPLVEALANPKEWVRWEAAKALGEINVPWGRHANKAIIRAPLTVKIALKALTKE